MTSLAQRVRLLFSDCLTATYYGAKKKKSYRNLPNNSPRDFLQRYRVPFRPHCYVWHLGVGGIAACTWVKRALPTHLAICSVRHRLALTHLFSRHCVHMHSKVSAAQMCSHFYFTVYHKEDYMEAAFWLVTIKPLTPVCLSVCLSLCLFLEAPGHHGGVFHTLLESGANESSAASP